MASIIKAVCTTNSADDTMGRVRLRSEGIWNQDTELVQSVNGCALSKGDVVFVSIEDSYYNPLILGKADRNNIVLNLLVEKINRLEDKVNDIITTLSNPELVYGTYVINNMPSNFNVPGGVSKISPKTKLKDIQDNYK